MMIILPHIKVIFFMQRRKYAGRLLLDERDTSSLLGFNAEVCRTERGHGFIRGERVRELRTRGYYFYVQPNYRVHTRTYVRTYMYVPHLEFLADKGAEIEMSA